MSHIIEKPKVEEVTKNYENGLGLKIMSLDFNTTEKVIKNQKRWNKIHDIWEINY